MAVEQGMAVQQMLGAVMRVLCARDTWRQSDTVPAKQEQPLQPYGALDGAGEHAVGPAALVIHLGGAHLPVPCSLHHSVQVPTREAHMLQA